MGNKKCNSDCRRCIQYTPQEVTHPEGLDAVLVHKWFGIPILLLVLFCVFSLTFALGAYPQRWIENGILWIEASLRGVLADGWFASMVIDGIIEGVGTVLSFLPNIIILFFFLSVLEESGFMDRAAYVMDELMHRIGLHGRSFVPMLIGFGCNVPAIAAARSIKSPKDRLLTMLMIPYMSCSARLPVYMLFVSVFFKKYQALVMMGIYAVGVLLAIAFAFVMKHTPYFRKGDEEGDVESLSPLRVPGWAGMRPKIFDRTKDYLQKITNVILAATVIIWALEYFPADRTRNGLDKEESYLASIGKAADPVMSPLGFDWRMNVCLLTGLPAKEAIVSTIGILYHTDDGEELAEALRADGTFTPAACISFLLFVLLYFPCVATIGSLWREAGWKWALFSVAYSILLAWTVSFIAYHAASL